MTLLASHTLPCLGRTFFLTEGTMQLSRASFSPFLFFFFKSVSSMYATITAHYYLSFTSSSYWAPFPPKQPSCTSVSLFSADIMPDVTCSSSLLIIAAPMPYPKVVFHSSSSIFQILFPCPPFPWRSLDLGWGWYRCYTFGWGPENQLFASFWPVLSLCINGCRS